MEPDTPTPPGDDHRATPWRRDPYALGFIALLAVAFIIGVTLAVRALQSREPSPPAEAARASQQGEGRQSLTEILAKLHLLTREVAGRVQEKLNGKPPGSTPSRPTTGNDPARTYPALTANQIPATPHVLPVPANAAWAYDVSFGPQWNKAGQLQYLTLPAPSATPPQATMSWVPSVGKATTWNLGVVAANHPSHANTRFPGFFMHAAYLPEKLQAGSRLKWEFPWQGGDSRQAVRVRRYEMAVTGWERVSVPAGEFEAAQLDGTLRYVEGETVRAEVRYRLWYSPRVKQVVRLVWIGRAPDESGTEMIAELAGYRAP